MSIIATPELAAKAYDILVAECGAPESARQDFCAHHTDSLHRTDGQSEWRFVGILGFGGKFRRDSQRYYVDSYPEAATPNRQVCIVRANWRLAALFGPGSPPALGSAWIAIFGAEVLAGLDAEKSATVPRSEIHEDCFQSGPLCAWQTQVHALGFRGARLVKTKFGWSVQAVSGLDSFSLIASARAGEVDGSIEGALLCAWDWQAADPARRYVLGQVETLPAGWTGRP